MGTLTQGLFSNQKANDWFSSLSKTERNEMIKKHGIPRNLEDGNLLNGDVLKMFRAETEKNELSGIELIAAERKEQLEKHSRTVEEDVNGNDFYQLCEGARGLLHPTNDGVDPEIYLPEGWSREIWRKMFDKPYKKRLIIAGALVAAEIDRISFLENLGTKS